MIPEALPDFNFDELYDELKSEDDELEYPDNDDIEEDDNYLNLDLSNSDDEWVLECDDDVEV